MSRFQLPAAIAAGNAHQELADGPVNPDTLRYEPIAVSRVEAHTKANAAGRLVERRDGAPLQSGAAVGGDEIVQCAPDLGQSAQIVGVVLGARRRKAMSTSHAFATCRIGEHVAADCNRRYSETTGPVQAGPGPQVGRASATRNNPFLGDEVGGNQFIGSRAD